jgi:hypothetical protein
VLTPQKKPEVTPMLLWKNTIRSQKAVCVVGKVFVRWWIPVEDIKGAIRDMKNNKMVTPSLVLVNC